MGQLLWVRRFADVDSPRESPYVQRLGPPGCRLRSSVRSRTASAGRVLETLNRIATTVGSTAQALLAEANAPTRPLGDSLLVVRADVGLLVAAAHAGDGEVRSLVDASAGFEAMEIRGAPDRFGEAYRHAGTDLLYVVTGEIETEIGRKRRRLGPGDAITYSGDRPHRTRRLGGDVHLIIVTVR